MRREAMKGAGSHGSQPAGLASISTIGRGLRTVALVSAVVLGTAPGASADEADAKRILRAMSTYVAAQASLSFEFDAVLEVVTKDGQKLALASSGAATLERPDKMRVSRSGGFADVEMFFDGSTLTLLGKGHNLYAQIDVPGSIDNMVEVMRVEHDRPLPAADLLLSNAYDALMADVVDVKDLGSGVVGGVECDFLAFRAKEVDWQIWIAQGERPYPCRYSIATKVVAGGPQYTVQVRNWKTGSEVAATDFTFRNVTQATKVELKDNEGLGGLPAHFDTGDAK